MTELNCEHSQLQSFPVEIGNLSNLKNMVCSFNHLQTLPVEIRNLSNLQTLYCNNNNLQTLPVEIGNLSKLCYLDANNDRLKAPNEGWINHDNTEYWLISVPGDGAGQAGKDQIWNALQNKTMHLNDLSINYKFSIPDLKVGTLDSLMSLSDTLAKADHFAEIVTRKLVSSLADLLADHGEDKLAENLKANGMTIDSYLTRFLWDAAKYPLKLSITDLHGIISKQLTQIDTELKNKMTAYSNKRSLIASLDRKTTGNLLTRELASLVKEEHFVLGSEFIVTLLVCVPRSSYKEWRDSYERIVDFVVPRSSQLISEDGEYGLFNVSIFKRWVDDFRNLARERKFIVRDFEYDPNQLEVESADRKQLNAEKKKMWAALVRWGKTHFSEAFTSWIHVKALRLFVESVLRYGLPVNFQAVLMLPHAKGQKKLRGVLQSLFSHLDGGMSEQGGDDVPEVAGLASMQTSEYFSYVFFRVSLVLADHF